ncbi:AAA family ATPase [Brevibacterium aurantiacum]|uniref:AAA domain (Dynein-related subfamily) n=1 Tax=Brevibacterium aurantiacum TaxID=273384 RepID=A0A2H1KNX6_BREAU|nr:AAA family ATPase [Brevibacterium aurantiacum]GEB24832.1 hypothetical protein BAU01nite_35650 [Brevibacterium aurantiacum]SMY01513.1 AAA domain (dynein-related subfamily) [Brevibacterium aurantiacum]
MAKHSIDSIWWLQINANDYLMTEWDKPSGAKGQQHYDVPNADNLRSFFDCTSDYGAVEGADLTKNVYSIGNPTHADPIPFFFRKGGRALIKLQNIYGNGHMRPFAWSHANNNWPKPSDPHTLTMEEAEEITGRGLLIYVVKTTEGKFFAGFTHGKTPRSSFPDTLQKLIPSSTRISGKRRERTGLINVHNTVQMDADLSPLAQKILDALDRNKNILLYGPPGTGKTHALNQVRRFLDREDTLPKIELDDSSTDTPFVIKTESATIPTPSRVEFVTFHQDFGYEDFVVGLRPVPSSSLELKPFAGILLDCAIAVSREEHGVKSAVVMVDEMNRGNVPKILGDFLTFMDDTYRSSPEGDNDHAIPVRFAKMPAERVDNGILQTTGINRLNGGETPLKLPWYFPHHVYVLATMNSVDKSVAPLDSAIGRRFERIDAFPDTRSLAEHLGVSPERFDRLQTRSARSQAELVPGMSLSETNIQDDLEEDALETELDPNFGTEMSAGEDNFADEWSPQELAVLLLQIINNFIDDVLGVDFELGHTYFWSVREYTDVISAWDTLVWPQLRDRFGARPQELVRLLRANQNNQPVNYAFTLRTPTSKHVVVRPLADISIPDALASLRFLAEQ